MENQVTTTQNNAVTTLYDKVKVVNSVINQATQLNIEATNLQLNAEKERKNAKLAKRNRILMPIVTFVVCLFGIFIIAPIAAIIVAIVLWLPKNGPKPHLLKADECEQASKEKFEKSNALVEQHIETLSIIPQKYWYPMATNFLVEVIETGRATTLPIAFDKLEEQIHRWNMEASIQQQIAIQMAQTESLRRIEINTAASAAADIASLIFG